MLSARKVLWLSIVLFHFFTPSYGFSSPSYCLAIRGNGEAQPAHWGALANLVEKLGLPEAQSGGSSGAISMFLLENISRNPWIQEVRGFPQEGLRAAFLLKSLQGISTHISSTPQAMEALDLLHYLKTFESKIESADLTILSQIVKEESLRNFFYKGDPAELQRRMAQIKSVVKTLGALGIGRTQPYEGLFKQLLKITEGENYSPGQLDQLQFYADDLMQAITSFGAFDAESDPALLFRQGIINFEDFAKASGRIATFLSGDGWNDSTVSSFNAFVNSCYSSSRGISWSRIVSSRPSCQDKLSQTLKTYFDQDLDWPSLNVVHRPIGKDLDSYPSTSVLSQTAYEDADQVMVEYFGKLNKQAAMNFVVRNPEDVKFGYWGKARGLRAIESGLKSYAGDAKSQKFLPLGQAKWLEALRLSPAEPGLASLRPMKVGESKAFSAGGWSDLHPVLVLKASGCDKVVYVTRKGGESVFAQGIAKRLLNFNRDWKFFRTRTPEDKAFTYKVNREGDPNDMTSLWSQLYNVANPNSSYMKSVALADAVVCTNWDRYNVKEQLNQIIEEAYFAPIVTSYQNPLLRHLESVEAKKVYFRTQLGSNWVGCR